MKKRNLKGNNKGFTLVELIVVLVILAILAAILVPALLGYIDSARNKQTLLNARSVMTAAQAEMSAIYGSKTAIPATIVSANSAHKDNLKATADFDNLKPAPTNVIIGCAGTYTSGDKKAAHDAFTIDYVFYKDESGAAVVYREGEWMDYTEDSLPTSNPSGGSFFPILPASN